MATTNPADIELQSEIEVESGDDDVITKPRGMSGEVYAENVGLLESLRERLQDCAEVEKFSLTLKQSGSLMGSAYLDGEEATFEGFNRILGEYGDLSIHAVGNMSRTKELHVTDSTVARETMPVFWVHFQLA